MNEELNGNFAELKSDNIDQVEQALSSIVGTRNRIAIPYLLQRLTSTKDVNIRNAVAVALGDLHADEAVPALLELVKNPDNKGYTGTLLYALQNLDCRDYFLDFIDILGEGGFENSEMALSLIEKYADEVDYTARLRAIDVLECLKKNKTVEKSKNDDLNYIEHALELLRE